MKRIWIAALLCLLLGTASADTVREYALTPAQVNVEALLEMTFGDQAKDAVTDGGEYPLYGLQGYEGRPFCGLNDTAGFGQLCLTSYPIIPDSENPSPGIPENIEPSGVAKCKLTVAEAKAMAQAWLDGLGIGDAYLQSVTAFGRLEGYSSGYVLAYGQRLNGLPVYWAAATQRDEWFVPQSNRIQFIVGDSGLISMSGYWSAFTPSGKEAQALTQADAGAAFAATGEQADSAELCYLLTGTQDAAVAVPAYRYQNRFISAVDGSILQ